MCNSIIFSNFCLFIFLDAKEGIKIKEWKLTGMDEILTDLEVITYFNFFLK